VAADADDDDDDGDDDDGRWTRSGTTKQRSTSATSSASRPSRLSARRCKSSRYSTTCTPSSTPPSTTTTSIRSSSSRGQSRSLHAFSPSCLWRHSDALLISPCDLAFLVFLTSCRVPCVHVSRDQPSTTPPVLNMCLDSRPNVE